MQGSTSSSFPKPSSASPRPLKTASRSSRTRSLKRGTQLGRAVCPTIADDSGLIVDALGGEPGVRSARYAGETADDRKNVAKLLDALRSVADGERGARFYCVLVALVSADDPAPVIASGEWQGRIAAQPRGSGGFGYDPIFVDPTTGQTAAELGPAAKNRVSHRGRALAALVTALRARWPASGSKSLG